MVRGATPPEFPLSQDEMLSISRFIQFDTPILITARRFGGRISPSLNTALNDTNSKTLKDSF